jgi:phosphatidylethanolamine/phosphatidyl-N-methylethanolamine N-methyltransferase
MPRRNLTTREKYDRMAREYDLMELLPEALFFGRFRKALFAMIRGRTLLEVGVGTGKNIEYYPRDMQVTAVDFSAEMLKHARRRAEKLRVPVTLEVMDIESLQFKAASFDAVVSTFVFCSVPDPLKGLAEVKRVLQPQGTFYALEHVRPRGRTLGKLFDRAAPYVERCSGVHIDRHTVDNIGHAGFAIELEKNLILDVLKMIVAKPVP